MTMPNAVCTSKDCACKLVQAHPELRTCRNFTDTHLSNKDTPLGFY